MAGIPQLFQALALLIPVPALVALAVLGAAAFVPAWLESIRQRQVRGLVRRLVRADQDARTQLEGQLEALCGANVHRWTALVAAADHYGQPALRDAGLLRLEGLGAAEVVRQWRRRDGRDTARPRDPLEAIVRIENLYRSGLNAAADEALAEARRQFPEDSELAALTPPPVASAQG